MKLKNTTLTVVTLAVLTALYVVLSAFLKINIIGDIQLDLGYLAFAVALCMFGIKGAVVGIIGCALESLLFSAYGFSTSWTVANAIIGIGCGLVFMKTENYIWRLISIILFCTIGLLGAKTGIECVLYHIPLGVKIVKNAVAFGIDTIVMIFGLSLYRLIYKRLPKTMRA